MKAFVWSVLALSLVGCGSDPNRVTLTLAPDLVSSQIGTIRANAQVDTGSNATNDTKVEFSVSYQDRSGTDHAMDAITDTTDSGGNARVTFSGLQWEGGGTITAKVLNDKGVEVVDSKKAPVEDTVSFGVLDETPPVVQITKPADGAHFAIGANFTVTLSATDEIGISQTFLQTVRSNNVGGGGGCGGNTNRIGSGAGSVSLDFNCDTGSPGAGSVYDITIFATATDLSGNIGTAAPVTIHIP